METKELNIEESLEVEVVTSETEELLDCSLVTAGHFLL
jgi:hypothetical protein